MSEISSELAEKIETLELNAWVDMFAGAPAEYVRNFQLETKQVDDTVVLLCRKIPFPHFNSVINLGGGLQPATTEKLDKILAIYEEAKISNFYIHYNPYLQPDNLTEWFSSRDLKIKSGWDRIYRMDEPLAAADLPKDGNLKIEKVTEKTAFEWANFVSDIYGLPTAPWLRALVDCPDWHHYIETDGAKITAARSMYVHSGTLTAWLGIDAPVPGLMIPTFNADFRLCRAIVEDGLRLGVKFFIADIEKPSPEMNTTPYRNFASIGFKRAYLRTNYGP
jgi:hypothetical protein